LKKSILIITLLAAVIVLPQSSYAQDTTKSLVIKTNRPSRYPLIKPKYSSYPLIAAYLLVKQANEGDPYAEHELGLRYLFGKGFPADTALALKWIKKAVDKNLPYAKFNYAIMLNNGAGVPWNPFEAFENFMFAAKSGMPEAQYAVGVFYTDNLVVNRNYNEAYKWIKKAADSGLDYAVKTLKKLKESGLVTDAEFIAQTDSTTSYHLEPPVDISLIEQNWELDYFSFDADSTDEKKEETVKELLNKNKSELKQIIGISDSLAMQDTSAVALINLAGKSGSPEALYIAGMSYMKGIEREPDSIKAAVLFIRAYRLGSMSSAQALLKMIQKESFFATLKDGIEAEDADAMFAWAGLTALGFDFQLTDQQAFDLLEKAVKKNHIPSLIEMGLAYYSGSIVKKDKDKAMEYWQKAAELGSLEAKVRYAFTAIIEKKGNATQHLSVLQGASEEGSVLAQSALGYCYENGLGIEKNKAIAVSYYRTAAMRGNEVAFESLKKIYDSIRPNKDQFQIYEAENR